MRKLTTILAAAALLAGSPAFAGEITGNGKPAQGAAHAASECSYSGLNDTPWDLMGFVQTFHSFWNLVGFIFPGDPFHPGQACRG
jgi:hypothetical protein